MLNTEQSAYKPLNCDKNHWNTILSGLLRLKQFKGKIKDTNASQQVLI